jgi:Tfp pilus tip-associated adhesin PilY1
MKTKSLLSILLLITFGTFSSCDLFDKADDISFNATLPLNFSINEGADNPTGMSYSDSELLDATSNSDVAKYASKIKAFKVNKITYTISGANPNTVTFTNGALKVSSTGKTIASVSSASLSNPTETELTADTAGFNELAAKLLDDKQELILLNGTLSKTPVAFSVKFNFYVTITADAL